MKNPVAEFVKLANGPYIGYDEPRKTTFHRLAKKVAKMLAEALELPPGSYEIRTNMGGIAVCGETTLHGENIYVQLGQSVCCKGFMYRHCKGRKDYTGGSNQWMNWETLLDFELAVASIRRVMGASFVVH